MGLLVKLLVYGLILWLFIGAVLISGANFISSLLGFNLFRKEEDEKNSKVDAKN